MPATLVIAAPFAPWQAELFVPWVRRVRACLAASIERFAHNDVLAISSIQVIAAMKETMAAELTDSAA